MILTKQELRELTGYVHRDAQARWFNRHLVGGKASTQEPKFVALLHHG
jgi:hypothetical protein